MVRGEMSIYVNQRVERSAHCHLVTVNQSLHDSHVEFLQVEQHPTNTTMMITLMPLCHCLYGNKDIVHHKSITQSRLRPGTFGVGRNDVSEAVSSSL